MESFIDAHCHIYSEEFDKVDIKCTILSNRYIYVYMYNIYE